MNLKQKLFYAVGGFLIGNMILASMIFGISYSTKIQTAKDEIPFDEALRRIRSKQIKEIRIKDDNVNLSTDTDNQLNLSELSSNQKDKLLSEAGSITNIQIAFESASSNGFERLFQIMFILFFISPPIIALMLFLIWKELKKRNELK